MRHDDVRRAVIDAGYVIARKLATEILRANPDHPEEEAFLKAIFGDDANSVAIDLKLLMQDIPEDDDKQRARQVEVIANLREAISDNFPQDWFGLITSPAQQRFQEIYDAAFEAGTDTVFVFGSVQGEDETGAPTNHGSNYQLKSGSGIILGGDLTDQLRGYDNDDVLLSTGGNGDMLDGGAGNEVVVASAGQLATTIGGLGRDVVANYTLGGVVYGDTESKTYEKPVFD